ALLRNVGLAPERWRVNVHRRVLDELEGRFVNTGIISRNALEALENLQRMRVRADYDLNARIRQRNINRAVNLFEGYFNECCHLLEVR
ncbi:MAG: hypothetical protein ACE5PV_26140, partial [Candidatus Poribacteria bacterium]